MSRQVVLLIFGGESSEHDVSVRSAQNVFTAMDTNKYDTRLCFIDHSGKWWLVSNFTDALQDHPGHRIAAIPGEEAFMLLDTDERFNVDVLLPILHGENGHEDGAIQGVANLLHIPCIGSDIAASAICWNKLYTKQLLAVNNLPVTPCVVARRGEELPPYEKVISSLGDVVFVKPATAGSSIGVSRVVSESEYLPALNSAFKHSSMVLIETEIAGRELEVGVLGNPPQHIASDVGEIIPGDDFYSYEDKYASSSAAQVILESDINDELRKRIRTMAHKAYQVLGCAGLARVDFLMDAAGEIYINEINTLPGFTNISQYPKLWQQQGISYSDLIDRIIMLSLQK